MTLEKEIERWYCGALSIRGVDTLKLHSRGWPDRACFALGNVCFIEFKRPKETIKDPHQKMRKALLEQAGFVVFEISEKSEEILEKILQILGFRATF